MERSSVTGRCYCGKATIAASEPPLSVAYCHCVDCRRVTGAPVAAFAAFRDDAVTVSSTDVGVVQANPGVTRTFCNQCGSPLTGRYDYLPSQVYVAIGLLDQASEFAPETHAHAGSQLPWLKIEDDLERCAFSARETLNEA